MTPEERQRVVDVAKEWIGTPYRGWSCLKGAGCDCGQFVRGVYLEAFPEKFKDCIPLPKDYSLQIWQHKEDTTYLDIVSKYMREILESEILPGDVVLYKFGKGFAHGAIVVSWPEFVIHSLERYGVHGGHGKNHKFGKLERKSFTLKDEHS